MLREQRPRAGRSRGVGEAGPCDPSLESGRGLREAIHAREPGPSGTGGLSRMTKRQPSFGGSLREVPKTGVLPEGRLQETWIAWSLHTARGSLVSTGPTVAHGTAASADSTEGGDVTGPITCQARESMRPLGRLPFCIVECAVHGAFFSRILASWRRTVGEELELWAYKKGGAAPSFPLSMACLLLSPWLIAENDEWQWLG